MTGLMTPMAAVVAVVPDTPQAWFGRVFDAIAKYSNVKVRG
jgi:hypothetical protein